MRRESPGVWLIFFQLPMTLNVKSKTRPSPVRIVASFILIIIYIALAAYRGINLRADSRQYVIVITEGTAERIEAGVEESNIPHEIEMVLGVKDVLVIRNEDTVWHTVGPYGVAAGKTIVARFTHSGEITQTCSITPTGTVRIVIRERSTIFTPRNNQG